MDEKGRIGFRNNISPELYEIYKLSELQKHFDILNAEVDAGQIVILKDLTIIPIGYRPNATYGQWTYHWWGYDRLFTNSQTEEYINYCNTVAAGSTIVSIGGFWFPPIGVIATFEAGYFSLLAARLEANNRGWGVYAGFTWVGVFDIEPL